MAVSVVALPLTALASGMWCCSHAESVCTHKKTSDCEERRGEAGSATDLAAQYKCDLKCLNGEYHPKTWADIVNKRVTFDHAIDFKEVPKSDDIFVIDESKNDHPSNLKRGKKVSVTNYSVSRTKGKKTDEIEINTLCREVSTIKVTLIEEKSAMLCRESSPAKACADIRLAAKKKKKTYHIDLVRCK